MRICYFVSEYPAVSHSFIRREILELERAGISVLRVSLRGGRALADPDDIREKRRTRYILDAGPAAFGLALAAALLRPVALARTVGAALAMMRRSSRPAPLHAAYLAEALVLSRWTRREGIDHLHAHFGTNGAEVVMLSSLLSGTPYSFTVHGPDEFDRPEYLGLPAKVARAAFVSVVSSFTGSQLRRWVPSRDWPKIRLVRCGLDAGFLSAPAAGGVPATELVAVGRLSEQKGHLVLLQALALLDRADVPFRLTLVGDGPLRPAIEESIRTLGLEGRVVLAGSLSSEGVREAIGRARALVLPSFAEGLPVVLMEALALGRPVVATYVAGVPELVTDGVCGWLVPAGDAEALADALRTCLAAPDEQIRAMGEAGRSRVLERHDITRECRTLADLFRARNAGAAEAEQGGAVPQGAVALRG